MPDWTEKLILRKSGRVGHIVLNQPEKRNALSFSMWRDLPKLLDELAADDTVRVVVLSGAGGKAFCAGADISEFAQVRTKAEDRETYDKVSGGALKALREMPKIVIAMIDGFCVGGGAELAMACDILIASERASFGVTPAKLGLAYPLDDVEDMVQLLGPRRTTEILATGRLFSAQDALDMGWVNRVVPAEGLEDQVMALTEQIADNAPLTVRAVKVLVRQALQAPQDRDLALCDQVIRACDQSADYLEGQQAFKEKRKPRFQGR